MEKIETKILAFLPTDENDAKSETDVLTALGCSHGSFFASVKKLLSAGLVCIKKAGRHKLYYKARYEVTNYEKPPDKKPSASSVAKKNEKKTAPIMSDYNDNFEGVFASVAEFCSVVSAMKDFEFASPEEEFSRIIVSAHGDMLRYDYAVISGGIEVWRFRIKQTYKRRFPSGA